MHLLDLNSPRCNKCLTKLWCSKECLKQDWEIAHKDTCTEEPDKRKVKAGKKKRTVAGVKMQKSYFKESADVALANGRPNAVSFINEVAAACNEDNKEEERKKNSKDISGGTRGSDLA